MIDRIAAIRTTAAETSFATLAWCLTSGLTRSTSASSIVFRSSNDITQKMAKVRINHSMVFNFSNTPVISAARAKKLCILKFGSFLKAVLIPSNAY